MALVILSLLNKLIMFASMAVEDYDFFFGLGYKTGAYFAVTLCISLTLAEIFCFLMLGGFTHNIEFKTVTDVKGELLLVCVKNTS